MLNIISRSLISNHTRGPRKVVINLINGLDEINYPYVLNADLGATNTIWIHDDKDALEKVVTLPGRRAIIAGPNIYTLPSEIPQDVLEKDILFLQPALWTQNFWNTFSLQKLNCEVWPVGIDTESFSPYDSAPKDLVLVYNKQRPVADVEAVCRALEAEGEKFATLTYGKYSELEYQKLLKQAKAVVWVGRSESQGIGLLEALAMNIPMLVWDVTKLGDFVGAEKSGFTQEQLAFSQVTAVPYFTGDCGLRFTDREALESTLGQFLNSLSQFKPRDYVEAELSLNKQAQAFIDLYKSHFSTTEAELRDTTLRTQKKWKNASLKFKLQTHLKDAVRAIIS